jgi:protein gp37
MTKIEWTEKTWNPIVGCSIVSPGCTNCYAMKMAARIERMGGAPQYDGTTKPSRAGAVWTGKVTLAEKALLEPLKRKKPTMYFVNSMGDLFHEDVPDDWIDRVFAVMALCPQHTFQVLTKRSARMRAYCTKMFVEVDEWDRIEIAAVGLGATLDQALDAGNLFDKPLPNIWLGVSAEDQTRADERIPDLLDTPAAVRFVSVEPLLGAIDLRKLEQSRHGYTDSLRGYMQGGSGCAKAERRRIDWVIVGGESSKGARPMHPDWARSLRDQCAEADVAFFFKQWGEYADHTELHSASNKCGAASDLVITPGGHTIGGGSKAYGGFVDLDWEERRAAWMCKVGKKAAGRMLDGRTHDEMPDRGTAS